MKMINLTPHVITVVDEHNKIIREYPISGIIARAKTIANRIDILDGIPVFATVFGAVENLPEPKEDTVYIVSMVVAQAVSGRKDVVAPDTGPTAYRYTEGPNTGKIIGVRAFVQY